ncbi:MAG: ester cyclase, partial [Pseudomonadota bacterium]
TRKVDMALVKKFALAALMLVSFLGFARATSLEEQEALSARSIEMWANGNTELVDETFADGYLNHQEPDVQGGTLTLTTDQWVTLLHQYHESFPETTVEILMQVAQDDLVATRWRFTATQTGTYLGLAPTGRTVTWTGTQIDRFEDGLIAETWVNWDMYGMFEQLGLLHQN